MVCKTCSQLEDYAFGRIRTTTNFWICAECLALEALRSQSDADDDEEEEEEEEVDEELKDSGLARDTTSKTSIPTIQFRFGSPTDLQENAKNMNVLASQVEETILTRLNKLDPYPFSIDDFMHLKLRYPNLLWANISLCSEKQSSTITITKPDAQPRNFP